MWMEQKSEQSGPKIKCAAVEQWVGIAEYGGAGAKHRVGHHGVEAEQCEGWKCHSKYAPSSELTAALSHRDHRYLSHWLCPSLCIWGANSALQNVHVLLSLINAEHEKIQGCPQLMQALWQLTLPGPSTVHTPSPSLMPPLLAQNWKLLPAYLDPYVYDKITYATVLMVKK